MKPSRYSFFFEESGKERFVLAFNGLTSGFAKLDEKSYNTYLKIVNRENVDLDDADVKETVRELRRGMFLLNDDFDEIRAIKLRSTADRFSDHYLSLTIAPTLDCNFACKYCYEYKKPAYMNETVENRIIEFVKGLAPFIKAFTVAWYGGEPLLTKDQIYRLSEKLAKICEASHASYSASIITNGYLLTKSTASKLKELNVSFTQITLDGPKSIHDSRRPLRTGEGTFDVILNNIRESADTLQISVRVNIDSLNITQIPELLDILASEGLKDKITVYFGRTAPVTRICKDVTDYALDWAAFSKYDVQLLNEAMNRGFKMSKYPRQAFAYCGATALSSFVIDPSGLFHKCWNTVGVDEDAVGSILLDENTFNNKLYQWLEWDPISGDCKDCNVLPLCMGGCPYRKVESAVSVEKPQCEEWKYNLVDMLKLAYKFRMTEKVKPSSASPKSSQT